MRRAAIAAVLLAGAAAPAAADIYTDDLTRCVVSKSTDADKVTLVRWMFAAMSVHPAVKDLTTTTPAQREALNRQMGTLIGRLVADDCHAQAVAALKYDGDGAIRSSFEVLGRVAAVGLFSDPTVQRGMSAMSTSEANEKFKALAREAGVPTEPQGGK